MYFVTVRELRNKSAAVWRRLKKEKEIVVTSNGRPIALMSPVSDESLEDSLKLYRRARTLSAVERLQAASVQGKLDQLSLEEINKEIQSVRKTRP